MTLPGSGLSATELFGSGEGTDLAEAFRHTGVGAQIAQTLGGGAALAAPLGTELARACTSLVDIDLRSVALQGWRTHRDLHAAAVRTAASPGTTERIGLAEHVIVSEHHPYVEVSLHGRPPVTIPVDVMLKLLVHVVDATVRAGALIALEGGDADLSGTLTIHGVVVSAPPPRRIKLSRRLDLGDGVSLLVPHPG